MFGKKSRATQSNRTKLSLKTRLLLIVISALLVSIFGEILLQVHNWKQAIKSEVDSSFSLAKSLVGSNVLSNRYGYMNPDEPVVGALQGLRHVSVMVRYKDAISDTGVDEFKSFEDAGVPAWFVEIIYPYEESLPRIVISDQNNYGELIIEADPRDEIIEVWEDFSTQLFIIIFFSLFVSTFIYVGIDIGLRPLNELLAGFEKLEEGSFDVTVREDISAELAPIYSKFNHMVSVLKHTSEDNSLLVKKMVNLQEEERHALTRELHDEMAPHLFGIRVATSNTMALLKEQKLDLIPEQLNSIDNIVENLQQQMRRLLIRLRPLILDDLDLKEAILSIIDKKEISQLNIIWNIDVDDIDDLDDTINVTLYRITQECITNIVRHSDSQKANIFIHKKNYDSEYNKTHQPYISLVVEDDGKGLPEDMIHGFGLIGMRERIQALGGKFDLSESDLGGVKISAFIPLR